MTRNTLFKFFFIIFISIILFRGRIGADDLNVFLVSYEFYKSFNLENLVNSLEFQHRLVWLFIDFIIISIFAPFIEIFLKDGEFILKYLCGYFMTFVFVLSFYKINELYKKLPEINKTSKFIPIIFFSSSPIIIFFTGSHIESLVCYLFLIMFSTKSYNLKLILSLIIFHIKPYYLIVCLISFFIEDNFKIKKTIFFLSLTVLLIIITKLILISLSNDNYVNNFPFNLGFQSYVKNIFLILFSPSFGIIFSYFCCYFLFLKKNNFRLVFLKLFGCFTIIFFIAFFSWWHGQTPNSRYLLPLIFIFWREILISLDHVLKYSILKIKLSNIFLLISIIHLPLLEYRNTSIYDYENDTYTLGKAVGFDENKIIYDYNSFSNHHLIFSNKVIASKIFDIDFQYSGKFILSEYFFPQTSLSRLIYVLNRPNDKFFDNKLINNNFILLIYIFYSVFIFIYILFLIHEYRKFNKLKKE